jgi:hypothetical protein
MASSIALWGQSGTGSIKGAVSDSSGGRIQKAQVTLTQRLTSVESVTESNEAGIFIFPAVVSGPYSILVKAPGMRSWKADFTLLTGQTVELQPNMEVGDTAQVVNVEGDAAPLVVTTSGTLGNVLERQRVDQLPLNGRNFTGLLTIAVPGMENVASGPGGFLFGLRYAVEFQLDGAMMQEKFGGSTFARPPGLDSINEIQATTSASSAKFSRPGLVTVSTRSGTNDIHGSLFETARNNGLAFARARTDLFTTPPHLVRNEFGGSLGGPVWIPKLYKGRNRTFFFFNYEARRVRTASTATLRVATGAWRQGDFNGLRNAAGQAITIYDPFSTGPGPEHRRTPYPNNQIPLLRRSPVAKAAFDATPIPTLPNVNPYVEPNVYGRNRNRTDDSTFSLRLDHTITDRDRIFVRYTRGSLNVRAQNLGTTDGLSGLFGNLERTHTGALSYTHTFSPTLFSETLLNYQFASAPNVAFTDRQLTRELGIPNPMASPGYGWPNLSPDGNNTAGYLNYGTTGTDTKLTRIPTIDQNFTKIKGRHELLFGGRFRYDSIGFKLNGLQTASFVSFNSLATSLLDPRSGSAFNPTPNTGDVYANMFLGVAGAYQDRFWRNDWRLKGGETTLYFQDNFKVNSRLTLNLGLRWEFFRPVQAVDGGVVGWDPKSLAIVLGTTKENLVRQGNTVPSIINTLEGQGMVFKTYQEVGLPQSLVYNYWLNFGPRLGFAYRATTGKHPVVIRGGASLFAFPEPLRPWISHAQFTMPTLGQFAYLPNSAAGSPDGVVNYLLRNSPNVIAGVNSANVIDVNSPAFLTRGSQFFRVQRPDQPTDRAWTWNFTLEREIGYSTAVSASLLGTRGYNLGQWMQFNSPPASAYVWFVNSGLPLPSGEFAGVAQRPLFSPTGPGSVYGRVEVFSKVGYSETAGVQLQVQRRFGNGLGFQAFYVLTNSIRAGGNGWSDHLIENPEFFVRGAMPDDRVAANRLQWYSRNPAIPKHRFNYNWLFDLPVGRGRKFGGNMNRLSDALLGGWQIAGNGSFVSTYFTLPTNDWGPIRNVEVYGKDYPIQDCRSGVCYRGYLWWNGYIPVTQIGQLDSNNQCPAGRVCGLPANYTPAISPIHTNPNAPYYNTNTVFVTLRNGETVNTQLNTGFHPWRNQVAPGPWVRDLNASLWKSLPLRERLALQFHADFFNILNVPGTPGPAGDGIASLRTSANTPRQLQLTLRMVW